MSNQAIEAVFDALGDPTRRRIVERLRRGPSPVGELAEALPVGRPAVSKHLKVLEGAGLVEHRSVGTRNLYALAPGGFAALQQWLVRYWDTTLDAYAARVAGRTRRGKSDEPPADPPPGRRTGRTRRRV
jgi:DNA-binding transcriptional ArsR family regulator